MSQYRYPRTLAEQMELDLDVNKDGSFTAIASLILIDRLNSAEGEGEALAPTSNDSVWIEAYEDIEEERRRVFDF